MCDAFNYMHMNNTYFGIHVADVCVVRPMRRQHETINYPKMSWNLRVCRLFTPLFCYELHTQFVLLCITNSWPHQRITFIVQRPRTRISLCVRDFIGQSDFFHSRSCQQWQINARNKRSFLFGGHFGRANLSQCIQFKCKPSTAQIECRLCAMELFHLQKVY